MDFFVSLNLSIQFVLTHRSNPFSAKILLQAPSTDPLKKAICGDRAVPGERSSTPALTGPPFLTPEKIQPNCTIYMEIQKNIYIDYDEYCQNEFHVSNCPGLRCVEKSPSKGPIRRQLSYVLKESKF